MAALVYALKEVAQTARHAARQGSAMSLETRATTVLGVAFLIGQVVAWRDLVQMGFYVGSNPSSSFFYVFTATHAAHLIGGILALFYVLFRDFRKTARRLSLPVAAEITSYYWHFMDGLWLFLLTLLFFGA